MTDYTAILLYNSPELNRVFKQNDALLESVLAHVANVPDLKVSRENYKNGNWSWWYSVTSASLNSNSLKSVAEVMNKFDGINGSIVLRTATGEAEFLTPAPKDDRGFGALDPALKTSPAVPTEEKKPAPKKKSFKRFDL